MKIKRLFTLILLSSLAVPATTPGAYGFEGLFPGARYTPTRGAALGDSFQPISDDAASSLFINPAGFGHLRGTHLEPVNLSFYGTSDYVSQIGLGSIGIISLPSYKDTLLQNPKSFPGVGAQYVFAFGTRGLGFGVMARTDTAASYDDDAGTIRYRSNYQLIPAVGGGLRLASGVLRLGYSLQWVNQASGDVTVPQDDPNLGFRNGIAQGSGLSNTMAASLTIPSDYLPQFDVVARNVFNLKFGGFSLLPIANNKNGIPPEELMTFDGSFMISPKLGDGMTVRLMIVYKDFLNRYDNKVISRLSIGGEFDFRNEFFIRLGVGGGYPSAGIGFRRKTAEFGFAWYSVERGADFRSEREQRYLLQYQFRAF